MATGDASVPFPALATGFGTGDAITQIHVEGRRRSDAPQSVEASDHWHIGSVGKSITALMLTRLVEAGKLAFDDPITAHMDAGPDWADVTLRQVLAHRGRLPANPPIRNFIWPPKETNARQRLVDEALARPPRAAKFRYSNLGYMLIGRVIEEVTGGSWEAAAQKLVLEPMELTSAGFGAPPLPGPQGHRRRLFRTAKPVDPTGGKGDNPSFLAPAGGIYMSVEDFARYGQTLLRLLTGRDGIVSAAAYADATRPLTEPSGLAYGGGLIEQADPDSGTDLRWHNGSNTMWMAHLTLAPKRDRFAAACTNIGGGAADMRLAKVTREFVSGDGN